MPSISPNTPAAASYTVSGSKAFVANPLLDFNNVPRAFTIAYPDPAPAGLSIVLVRLTAPGGSVDLDALATAGTVDSASISGRDVSASRTTGGGTFQLTCNIQDPSEAGVIDEQYELRVKADAPVTWRYSVDNTFNSNVLRIVCDPVASFNGLPATLLERDELTLTADDAHGPLATPTLVRDAANPLTPAGPAVTYQFSHTGPIVIIGLPSPAGASNAYHLVQPDLVTPSLLPTVYGPTAVPMTVDVVYTGIGGAPGFLSGHGVGNTTIEPRPQQAVLVLDRTGSMGAEHRWDNAKTAAILFANLFGEFRDNVDAEDAIGMAVFQDPACAFRAAPPTATPFVDEVVHLDKPDQVAANLQLVPFGLPGSCTNIGEGLAKGLQMLQSHGMPANARYTVILMTDGDENSGTVKVGPGPDPSGAISWTTRITQPDISTIASHPQLNLFTIGLGSAPNNTVLNNLTNAKGHFRAAISIGEIIDSFTTMLQVAQDINKLNTRFTRVIGDPIPPAPQTEVFFDTTSAEKFGAGILKVLDPPTPGDVIDGVEIAKWNTATNSFDVQALGASQYDGHFYIGVPNAPTFGAGTQTWRIRRLNGTTAKPIGLTDVLAYEDLHVQSEFTLDRKNYLTGEDMTLFIRIRHNSAPILNATVRAELDAPEEGLGSLLAGLDADDIARQQHRSHSSKDRPTGKAALIDALLHKFDWAGLPRCNPALAGLFLDGTNELHDVGGDGTYTNTFAQVLKEGVYNWTLFVDGVDTNGNSFSHRLDASAIAAVSVSRTATIIRKETLRGHDPSYTAVKVTITPQDDFRGKLGPGFDDTVIWAVRGGGVFEHVLKHANPPVNTDGTYTRTVVFKHGEKPTLYVSVNGVILPKICLRHHRTLDTKTKAWPRGHRE